MSSVPGFTNFSGISSRQRANGLIMINNDKYGYNKTIPTVK